MPESPNGLEVLQSAQPNWLRRTSSAQARPRHRRRPGRPSAVRRDEIRASPTPARAERVAPLLLSPISTHKLLAPPSPPPPPPDKWRRGAGGACSPWRSPPLGSPARRPQPRRRLSRYVGLDRRFWYTRIYLSAVLCGNCDGSLIRICWSWVWKGFGNRSVLADAEFYCTCTLLVQVSIYPKFGLNICLFELGGLRVISCISFGF